MKRKFRSIALPFVLSLCMVLTLVPMPVAATVFKDGTGADPQSESVSASGALPYDDTAGHWAEKSIERWSRSGVVQGNGGKFDPDGQLTCAQLATVLANLLRLVGAPNAGFSDNDPSAWYFDAVNRCAAAGILQGNGDGTVTPNAPITRERAVVMLCRALGIEPQENPDLTKHSDADKVSAYAGGYLAAMHREGIITGVGGNQLAPQENITRASIVTILDRAIALYIHEEGVSAAAEGGGIILVVADAVKIGGSVEKLLVSADGINVSLAGSGNTQKITITGNNSTVTVDNFGVDRAEIRGNQSKIILNGVDAGEILVSGAGNHIGIKGSGTVGNLLINDKNIHLDINDKIKIDTIQINENARNTDIRAENGTTINKIENNAEGTTVSGSGTVKNIESDYNVTVKTDGTSVNKPGSGNTTSGGSGGSHHTHRYAEVVTKAPTCTEDGERTLTCSCGSTKTEVIPALGHDVEDGKCTRCGMEEARLDLTGYTMKRAGLQTESGAVRIGSSDDADNTVNTNKETAETSEFVLQVRKTSPEENVTVPEGKTAAAYEVGFEGLKADAQVTMYLRIPSEFVFDPDGMIFEIYQNGVLIESAASFCEEELVDADNIGMDVSGCVRFDVRADEKGSFGNLTIVYDTPVPAQPLAEVNGVIYKTKGTLRNAWNGLEGEDNTIKFLRDIEFSEKSSGVSGGSDPDAESFVKYYALSCGVTLDLNGKTVTLTDAGTNAYAFFAVENGGTLTVTGNGKLVSENTETNAAACCFYVEDGRLNIESGTFVGGSTIVRVDRGTANIKGGYYSGNPTGKYLLNCLDAGYQSGEARIVVSGGTFEGYNPAASESESPAANFVAAGYDSVRNPDENSWTVESSYDAEVDGQKYETVTEAVEVWKNGGKLTLLRNCTANVSGMNTYGGKVFTLDLNGKTLTLSSTLQIWKSELILEDSSADRAGMLVKDSGNVVQAQVGGKITVKAGEINAKNGSAAVANSGGFEMSGGILRGTVYALNLSGSTAYNAQIQGGTVNGNFCVSDGKTLTLGREDEADYKKVRVVGDVELLGGAAANFNSCLADGLEASSEAVTNFADKAYFTKNITAPEGKETVGVTVDGVLYYQVRAQAANAAEVAAADGAVTEYPSLNAAMAALSSGSTLRLLRNITLEGVQGTNYIVPDHITIDLNGRSIDGSAVGKDSAVPAALGLTVQNENGAGSVTITNTAETESVISGYLPLSISSYTGEELSVHITNVTLTPALGGEGNGVMLDTGVYLPYSAAAEAYFMNGGFKAAANGETRIYGDFSSAAGYADDAAAVLIKDYTGDKTIRLMGDRSSAVLDLNEKTYTFAGGRTYGIVQMKGDNAQTLTVKNGTLKSISEDREAAVKLESSNMTLILDGTEVVTAGIYGIAANGTNENNSVTLINSTIAAENGIGIYFPCSGTLMIDGGQISGKAGVEICAGDMRITGEPTISGSGARPAWDYTFPEDGSWESGAAVSILDGRPGYATIGTVEVENGLFTAANDSAITAKHHIASLGSFTNGVDAGKVAISGGTFKNAPGYMENLCAENYMPRSNADGSTTVVLKSDVAKIGEIRYNDLQAALNAADGKTVELLDNTELRSCVQVAAGTDVTLDLAGHTLERAGGDDYYQVIELFGSLTIADSSAEENGTIIGGKTVDINPGATLNVTAGTLKPGYGQALFVPENAAVTLSGKTKIIGAEGNGSQNSGAVIVENGTLTIEDSTAIENAYGLAVNASDSSGNGRIIINGGKLSGTAAALKLTGISAEINGGSLEGTGSDSGGILLFRQGYNNSDADSRMASLRMTDGTVSGAAFGISGNCMQSAGCSADITGGKVSGGVLGIYWPMEGALTIGESAEISGLTAIEAKMGTIGISGGTLIAAGAPAENGEGGAAADGSALKLVTQSYGTEAAQYRSMPSMMANVTGGDFRSTNGDAVLQNRNFLKQNEYNGKRRFS